MGTSTGQRFLCTCGATIQYVVGCTCDSRAELRCACGAVGTRIEDEA